MRNKMIVKYIGKNKNIINTWGEYFEVYKKEDKAVKLVSLEKPFFGVVASVPYSVVKIV